jgi:uncharacterized protein affecting Mg2+/Co2+ transport
MKLNSTVVLTVSLLAAMIAAGIVSATWGMTVGREALKGITQPDTRPTNNLARSRKNDSRRQDLVILREQDIISNVKSRMNGTAGDRATSPTATATPKSAASPDGSSQKSFPITSQSQGVVLEINSAKKQGDSFVLTVNLRNTSKQSVRFLYSFLRISDEQGRSLDANTEGLPAELPETSNPFSGTISIPNSTLQGSKSISLSLTDYPDQKLRLELSNIPVAQ